MGGLGIITLDPSVPDDQQLALEGDLQLLQQLNVRGSELLGSAGGSGPALTQWLQSRVQLVVGEEFNYYYRVGWDPAGAGSAPQIFASEAASRNRGLLSAESKVVTVMFNLGSYLYLAGRRAGQMYTLNVDSGTARINSPRIGIIQIGEGLFSVMRIQSSPVEALANQLLRLTVLFHEARHSDGNGEDAGLPHSKCPATVRGYAGKYSCEGYANGPYAVQAALLESFISVCSGCSNSETTAMRSLLADYKSRMLSGARYGDDRPEGIP